MEDGGIGSGLEDLGPAVGSALGRRAIGGGDEFAGKLGLLLHSLHGETLCRGIVSSCSLGDYSMTERERDQLTLANELIGRETKRIGGDDAARSGGAISNGSSCRANGTEGGDKSRDGELHCEARVAV